MRLDSNKFLSKIFILSIGILLITASNAQAMELVISGNGQESESEVVVESETQTTIVQENNMEAENNVETEASTGENEANGNIGEVNIDTGDIDETVSIENQANTSQVSTQCCEEETNIAIKDNGSSSQNQISVDSSNNTEVVVEQNANITNNIESNLNTGENKANDNNGNVNIESGDINASASVKNGPVNSASIEGGSGVGSLDVTITGNGTDSFNSIDLEVLNETLLAIENNADVENNIIWNANTGGNEANGNNGNVNISTGDIWLDLFLQNGPINIGGITWECCDEFDPGDADDPKDPGDPSDPDDPGKGGNGEDGQADDGGGSTADSPSAQGTLLSSAASTGNAILGLSDTSSNEAKTLLFWIGIAMIMFGTKFIGEELLSESS